MNGRKKRILHLLESGGMYGAENVVINLSREMLGGKYQPVIGCIVQNPLVSCDLYEVAMRHGIEAHKFVVNNRVLPLDLFRFARTLKKLNIDLVHSHGYKASVFSYSVKTFCGFKVMATCHLWFEGSSRPLKTRFMIALEKSFYRQFPVVVSVSEQIRQVLLGAGIDPQKLPVVKNGIVMSDYAQQDSDTIRQQKSELGLDSACKCILNVGRLTEQKAQHNLIEAARLLREKGYPIKVYIVGNGSLKETLQRQIDNYRLENTVKLLGFRDDIPKLLQLADTFVLPSLDEGMPIALLEAVASRVPVVTTPVGDIPKLIKDSISGLTVPVDDISALVKQIEKILIDEQLSHLLVVEAWNIMSSNYSSSMMSEEYSAIYHNVLTK